MCISFIIHVCVCFFLAWILLTGLPPVRFALMIVRAGSPEPVRVPQLIYTPVRNARRSTIALEDVRKAARRSRDVPVQAQPNDDADRADYAPTAIAPDILAMLETDFGQEPPQGAAIENVRRLSFAPSLGGRPVPDPPEPPPGNPDVRPPIVIGGHIEPAMLVEQTKPVYPGLARTARVEGIVVLEGTVNVEGRIENLHAVSGHPMLLEAAIKAVEKWKYRPAKLNGQLIPQPVRVEVRFTLQYTH